MTWIVLAGIVAQVTMIGLGIFYDYRFAEVHVGFGWAFGHLGPLLLIVGFFGRFGKTINILNAVTFVLLTTLPFMAGMRADIPLIAGLHPLVALSVFALTFYLAIRVRATLTARPTATQESRPTLVPPQTKTVVQGRVSSQYNR